jgi:hypothetical protein
MITEEPQQSSIKIGTIVHITIQAVLYFAGAFIHIRIISVLWKDKEGKTWLIHMTHSISLMIYFAFYIPFFTVTNTIPNLADQYTGEWFCYLASFITVYGFSIVTLNSLLIAVMKYVFIVHHNKALQYGDAKTKKLFFIINVTLPLFLAVFACITGDFESFSALNSCFGQTEQVLAKYNTLSKNFEKFLLCNLNKEQDLSYGHTFYVVKQVLCAIKSIGVTLINTNFPEAFFYYKIFQKMKW